MAQISEFGEYKFIHDLTKDIKIVNETTEHGIGDDAAVMHYDAQQRVLATTNQFMEGIHFNLTYFPPKHLGFKVAIASMSDIYAMNGMPTQLLLSMALSKRFSVEWVNEFYSGVKSACTKYNVDIVGGDTTASLTGLAINTTCMGVVAPEKIAKRSGAKETDIVCVSGDLGAAFMGFQLLERERQIFESQKSTEFEPDFAGKEYVLERALKPEPREDVIKNLKKLGIQPTSMIDVTKGLSSDMLQLCEHSNVGCRLFEDRLPIDYFTASMAEEFKMNLTTVALNGGDDFELLFTVPVADHDKVKDMDGISVIGYISEPSLGAALLTRDGKEFKLRAQSYTAVEEETE